LHDYIKVEQDITREDRKMLRELDREKLELEHKHKLELIAKLGVNTTLSTHQHTAHIVNNDGLIQKRKRRIP
jgi:hypothetical protein